MKVVLDRMRPQISNRPDSVGKKHLKGKGDVVRGGKRGSRALGNAGANKDISHSGPAHYPNAKI